MRSRALGLLAVAAALGLSAPVQARTLDLGSGQIAGPGAKVVKDRTARGGKAISLTRRGSARRRFTARSATRELVIRARANPCRGSARMGVVLDGRRLAVRAVRSRRFARYRLIVRMSRGSHLVRVRLANPLRSRSCNRRLVLDTVSFTEQPARAPVRGVAPAPVAAPRSPTPSSPASTQSADPTTPASEPPRTDPPPPSSAPPPPQASPSAAYRNPVFASPGAPDPMVLDVAGTHSDYYAFSTGERFPVLRSSDLVEWRPVEAALGGRPSWAAQRGEWNPWAPSVIERAGPCPGSTGTRCFVLFHVARHGTLSPPTNCVGVAVSPSPGGPYRELGPLESNNGVLDASGRPPGCGDNAGYSNIDPAPFVDSDGRAYLYLSTTRTCSNGEAPGVICPAGRRVSVLELTPDLLKAAGPRQALFAGDAATWEDALFAGASSPVVENPNPVRRGDTYFVLYSGGAFNGAYGMGYATSTTPTGPFVKATENPFLREANGVISVGGGALVVGPKGGDWLAYHGREGSYANPRQLRIDPLRFPTAETVAIDGPTSTDQATGP